MSNEEAVAYYLKKHPELKGIFALNETSTQLGIQVLDELDNSDEIQIVGFDAGKEQVKALEDDCTESIWNGICGSDRICPYSS